MRQSANSVFLGLASGASITRQDARDNQVLLVEPTHIYTMAVHDTIGDFLTVIRNAGSAGRPSCLYPHSKLRSGIASILKSRGFVEKFDELKSDKGLKQIEIHLKYVNGEHAIRGNF